LGSCLSAGGSAPLPTSPTTAIVSTDGVYAITFSAQLTGDVASAAIGVNGAPVAGGARSFTSGSIEFTVYERLAAGDAIGVSLQNDVPSVLQSVITLRQVAS